MTALNLTILSWNARGGGRAKALLSLANHCVRKGIDVTVALGGDWGPDRLKAHHGLPIQFETYRTGFSGDTTNSVREAVAETAPDVVLAFDTLLVKACRTIGLPAIGYLRTSTVPGVDEYWAPSKRCAGNHSDELWDRDEPPCRTVYPVWYIDPLTDPPTDDERPIDIMIHGRKAQNAAATLNPDYNVLLANWFPYPDLRAMYRQSKLMLFPRPERFEPLGLMPIEAAACGCRVLVPKNSGVAEVYPDRAYDKPTEHVDDALDSDDRPSDPVPESPIDPPTRIQRLAP